VLYNENIHHTLLTIEKFYELFDNNKSPEIEILTEYFKTCNQIFEYTYIQVTRRLETFLNICVVVEQHENSVCVTGTYVPVFASQFKKNIRSFGSLHTSSLTVFTDKFNPFNFSPIFTSKYQMNVPFVYNNPCVNSENEIKLISNKKDFLSAQLAPAYYTVNTIRDQSD